MECLFSRLVWFSAHSGRAAARNALICCIFLSAGCLWPQSARDSTIFIPPVSGTAGSPEDMAYFTGMIVMEVRSRNYPVTESKDAARYSLTGSAGSTDLPEEGEAPNFLQLSLTDNDSGEIMLEQGVGYTAPEDVNEHLPLLVFHFLSAIPLPAAPPAGAQSAGAADSDDWRHKWLYFSGGVFWSPRLYAGTFRAANLVNFGLGLSVELHLLSMMSLEGGVELTGDWITVSPEDHIEYEGQVLEIPFLLKLVLKPARHYMIEPYVGAQLNVSLNKFINPPPFSLLAGVQYGAKAGPGIIFVDGRFALDLGMSALNKSIDPLGHEYHRYAVKIILGYKFGIMQRSAPRRP